MSSSRFLKREHNAVLRDERKASDAFVHASTSPPTVFSDDAFHSASALQLRSLDAALLQFRATVLGREEVAQHELAARGTRGGGGPLPHLDRIQSAFGRHDVREVRAHVDGRAQEAADSLGARAYASNGEVVLGSAGNVTVSGQSRPTICYYLRLSFALVVCVLFSVLQPHRVVCEIVVRLGSSRFVSCTSAHSREHYRGTCMLLARGLVSSILGSAPARGGRSCGMQASISG